jgi:hypothetical protein
VFLLCVVSTAATATAQATREGSPPPDDQTTLVLPTWSADSTSQWPKARSFSNSDSLLNGALIGAGVGVASGLLACHAMEPRDVCLHDSGTMLRSGAIGAAIGLGVDALIGKQLTVYRKPGGGSVDLKAAPVAGPGVGGARFSLEF